MIAAAWPMRATKAEPTIRQGKETGSVSWNAWACEGVNEHVSWKTRQGQVLKAWNRAEVEEGSLP